jgi:peptide/nickel transport system permease protein
MNRQLVALLMQYLFLTFLVVTINFFIIRLLPGNPIDVLVRGRGELVPVVVSESDKQMLRRYYGLDQSLVDQYIRYLRSIARGDLGHSFYYHRPVSEIILDYAQRTLPVVIVGMALALIIGLPLGVLSASRRGQRLDSMLLVWQITLHSLPPFFIATILLIVFAVELKWFPFSGSASIGSLSSPASMSSLAGTIYHLALPSVALALWESSTIYYFTRNSLIDILGQDFILAARAKGLSTRAVLVRHALRVALPALTARFALMFGFMVGGVFFVEQVFSFPGVALLALSAFHNYDYLLLQGIFLLLTMAILVTNCLADVCMYKFDPRTREGA